MKKTQTTELLTTIKKTFVSFFSIVMFVALGAGVFCGIAWTKDALYRAADTFYDAQAFHNIQLVYPYGFTDEDIDEISRIDGVTEVEGVRQSQQVTYIDGESRVVKVQGVGERVNVLEVVEGSLPVEPGEIALEAYAAGQLGLEVGDTVVFEHDNTDESGTEDASADSGMQYLGDDTFTVTALVESPEYVAYSQVDSETTSPGSVNLKAWVAPEEFKADAFMDGYPVVNIRSADLEGLGTFTKRYKETTAELEDRISDVTVPMAAERYQSIRDQAQAEIDDAEQQLADAQQQVADGKAQLEDGERQLAEAYDRLTSAEAEIEAGWAELADKKAELSRYQAAYDSAVAGIEQARANVDDLNAVVSEERAIQEQAEAEKEATIDDLTARYLADEITQEEYDAGVEQAEATAEQKKAESDARIDAKCSAVQQSIESQTGQHMDEPLDHTNVDGYIDTAYTLLDNAYDTPVEVEGRTMTLNQARAELDNGWAQARSAESQLSAAEDEVATGWDEYNKGKADLEEGRTQVEEGQALIDEKSGELDAAKEALESFKNYDVVIAGRSFNLSAVDMDTIGGVTGHLSWTMAALFVVVGLLVSYSAMGRLVHEQVVLIGTKKALGFHGHEITRNFLAYAAAAILLGVVIGNICGVVIVENIIAGAMQGRYILGDYPLYFGWAHALGISAVEFALVLLSAWLACRSVLKEQAVVLLRGEKPPTATTRFYEKWKLWDKLPLLTQTMINNCINDKRRLFSTIVGVAGCTALVVTAITLNDDVLKSHDAQYERVYGHNAIVYVDPDIEGAADDAENALRTHGMATARVHCENLTVDEPTGDLGAIRVVVPLDEDAFSAVYHVNPIDKHMAFDLQGSGGWVNRAYHSHIGAEVGDDITLHSTDGDDYHTTILGFYQYYLPHNEVVMSAEEYERMTGVEPDCNTLLVDTGETAVAEVGESLDDISGFQMIVDDKSHQKEAFNMFSSLAQTVVLIYLILAILMSLVVLLNLNFMFINEKKRELIVLMINGFSLKDTKRYISNDTIILTIIGIVIGLALGAIMGAVSVWAIEGTMASFLKGIAWRAVLAGIGVTAILAIIMSAISLRRIPKFKLTDINKD